MNKELLELITPFPANYIKSKPGGRGGDYVEHGVVRQRLLDTVGFYDWRIEREIYDKEGKLTGCIGTLTIYVDGMPFTVQGAGDVEFDQGSNASNLKHAESDAIKRAAMNLGLGLHLWCGDNYFIYDKNIKKELRHEQGKSIDSESE